MMGWYKGEGVQGTTIHNRPCVPLRLSVGADVVRVLERYTCASAVVSYRPTDSPRPRESICYGYFGDIVAARIRRRRVAGRLRQLATAGAKRTKKLKNSKASWESLSRALRLYRKQSEPSDQTHKEITWGSLCRPPPPAITYQVSFVLKYRYKALLDSLRASHAMFRAQKCW